MEILFLIGRIVYGGLFVYWGTNLFLKLTDMTAYAKYHNVPAPEVAVLGTGVLQLIGGLSILLGYHTTIGSWLLVIFLVPVAIFMHNFWAQTDSMARASEMAHFLKNMAMAGAALMISTLSSISGWPISLGG